MTASKTTTKRTRKVPSRLLTLATLVKKGACPIQRARFQDLFGESVRVTEALCEKHTSDFMFTWAIRNLLPRGLQELADRREIVAHRRLCAHDTFDNMEGREKFKRYRARLFARLYIQAGRRHAEEPT